MGTQDHQSSGSQPRGAVPHCSHWAAPQARTIPGLQNGLNWSQILKSTAGHPGDVCGNLGRFSLRKLITLLCCVSLNWNHSLPWAPLTGGLWALCAAIREQDAIHAFCFVCSFPLLTSPPCLKYSLHPSCPDNRAKCHYSVPGWLGKLISFLTDLF